MRGRDAIARRPIRRSRPRAGLLTAAIVAVAASALVAGCGTTQQTGFTGYWRSDPTSQIGGSLLIKIDQAGSAYTITGLHFLGPSAGSIKLEEGRLVARGTGASGKFAAVFALSDGDQALTMALLSLAGAGKPVLTIPFVRAQGTPQQLAERMAAQELIADAARVKQGVAALATGLDAWALAHKGDYPPVSAVRPGGSFARTVKKATLAAWPTNPYTGAAMQPGAAPGDYTYVLKEAGRAYQLNGHVRDGADFVKP